jgi:hypothetical protein
MADQPMGGRFERESGQGIAQIRLMERDRSSAGDHGV